MYVLGGGASGMVAAITAARRGKKVTIIEHMPKLGKKIYATGNGKCNYTNTEYNNDSYRGEDTSIIDNVLDKFSYTDTICFFEELGIMPRNKNGYIYPYSEQASSIVEVLMMEIDRLGIIIKLDESVIDITINKGIYTIKTNKASYTTDKVIIAMGGMASSKLGSDGSGLKIMKDLGYKVVTPHKALVSLKCRAKSLKQIAGVRLQASITMYIENKKNKVIEYINQGEIIFTDYGISGIPIMQLSTYASKALKEKNRVKVVLDFFPDMEYSLLVKNLKSRRAFNEKKSDRDILVGMINNKLGEYIISKCLDVNISNGDRVKIKELASVLKGMELEVTDTNSWDNAQVMAGGISTKQINKDTMESKLHKGLYVTGEIMDIDGTCGGYNLQWAWASGYIAGSNV